MINWKNVGRALAMLLVLPWIFAWSMVMTIVMASHGLWFIVIAPTVIGGALTLVSYSVHGQFWFIRHKVEIGEFFSDLKSDLKNFFFKTPDA
jgi:hypothetical protein